MDKGTWGWLGMTIWVIGYDFYAVIKKKETMSSAFYRGIEHPTHRPWVVVLWLYITAHLFKFLPDRFDPLRRWVTRD